MSLLRARCPACGAVLVTLDELRCALQQERREALCQFECPLCGLTVTQELRPHEVAMLKAMGARALHGSIPFELVEHHSGPPLSLDDLLAFHEAISSHAPAD